MHQLDDDAPDFELYVMASCQVAPILQRVYSTCRVCEKVVVKQHLELELVETAVGETGQNILGVLDGSKMHDIAKQIGAKETLVERSTVLDLYREYEKLGRKFLGEGGTNEC